jgi:hypothetical protein
MIFCLGLSKLALAAGDLGKQLELRENLTDKMPELQQFKGTIYSEKRGYDFGFTAEFKRDKNNGWLDFYMISGVYDIKAKIDNRLCVITKELIFVEPKTIDRLGHDRRVTSKDPVTKEQVVTEFFLKGEKLKEKISPYQYYSLDLDIGHVILQTLLINNIKEFSTGAIFTQKGWNIQLEGRLVRTTDPSELCPQYKFPERLKEIFAQGKEFLVYEVKLGGVAGLFFKHKYYMVYSPESPYLFSAYWGGDPEWVEFIYTDEERADKDKTDMEKTDMDRPETK